MSEQPINSLYTDAITWLRDMGCDEPTDDVQRTFYGLRSKEKTSKLSTNSKPNTELKINTFNIEDINNIDDLYNYISLNPLPNSNITNKKTRLKVWFFMVAVLGFPFLLSVAGNKLVTSSLPS
jgi:hypothetical protein